MSYRMLQLFTVLLPALLIGGFEYLRHDYLFHDLSMEMGNLYITILTLLLSFLYSVWMFRTIRQMNERLAEERMRRAVYEERERLARELHDGIAQTLFFLNVKLKQGQVEDARAALTDIDSHVRQAIFNLRTSPEEGGSLAQRLHKWLGQWSARTGIEVGEHLQMTDGAFSPSEEVHLFGIVQEAFTNINKHAKASLAHIELQATVKEWRLSIRDDGQGIAEHDSIQSKYGLKMIAERADKLGASVKIDLLPNGGTQLTLTRSSGGN